MGGGGKIRYPKHVWSPAGGWYSQPANWRSNTAIMMGAIFVIIGFTWNYSAKHEQWVRYPAPDRFFPSRYWSKDLIEHDKKLRAQKENEKQ